MIECPGIRKPLLKEKQESWSEMAVKEEGTDFSFEAHGYRVVR